MTHAALIARELASMETHVGELKRLARLDQIDSDVREERFVLHTLQLAAQRTLDVASHVVSAERLGEPRANDDLIRFLAREGWLPGELATSLVNIVRARNSIVFNYATVDLSIVREIVEDHLDDLLDFARFIRAKMEED